jgi:uncharacterized protein with GYD domain
MKTFILMSRINPQCASLVEVAARVKDGAKHGRAWLDKVKEVCPEAKFIAHYAILGGYDFMDIYEAPSEETAVKIAMIGNACGAFNVESWTAIPDSRVTELASQIYEDFQKSKV